MNSTLLQVEILGVPIAALDEQALVRRATTCASRSDRVSIGYANAHTLNMAARDAAYRAMLRGMDLIYCDGAGVTLAARLLGQRLPGRMTGADWIEELAGSCADRNLKPFFLGSRPGVAEIAAARLQSRHVGLALAGTFHGFLADPEACAQAIRAINTAKPDLLLVGMGSPLQERWVAEHRDELEVPVVWVVGALFDFLAGGLRRGPRILLDHGFEWLARLVVEPKRLWRRYLLGNPLFILRVLRQRLIGAAPDGLAAKGVLT